MKALLVLCNFAFLGLYFITFPSIKAGAAIAANYNQNSITIPSEEKGEVFIDAVVMAKSASHAKTIAIAGAIQSSVIIVVCLMPRSQLRKFTSPARTT